MPISSDGLRRAIRWSQRDEARSHADLGEVIERLAEGDAWAGVTRRQFVVGGVSLLGSAVLAACSGTSPTPPTSTTIPGPTTTTIAVPSPDIGVLRLGSSIEHYMVSLYGLVAGSGLLKTTALVDAFKYFSDQHADHAGFFERTTRDHGGQPFASANPVIGETLKPRVDALSDEAGIVKLAYDVEQMAAATYFAFSGNFQDLRLNSAVAGVSGVEARHVAVLGMVLAGLPKSLPEVPVRTDSPPVAAGGVQTGAGAVAPGTGV